MSTYGLPKQIAGLVAWLGIGYATSAIGAAASLQAGPFYTALARPDWAPPPWLFGPVWILLYGLMGIAAWLVWRQGGFRAARTALTLFLVQLAVNAAWSWLFFGWKLGAWAFYDILLLSALIALTLLAFWRRSRTAGLLLLPYLLWVGFAAVLNYSVWQLNPQILG